MSTTPSTPSERAAHARHGYAAHQIGYHWAVVVLVVVNWLLGQGMEQVYEAREEGAAISNWGPAFMHIAIGVSILIVMLMRLGARIKRPVQTSPETKYPILALLGRINHWAFYVVLITMPLLGALAWFFDVEWAGDLHSLLSWILVALILLHVGGALLHLVLGENIIRRIVRPTGGT